MKISYGKWNLDEINELKGTKVITKVKIFWPGVVAFVFTKFQRDLSTFTPIVWQCQVNSCSTHDQIALKLRKDKDNDTRQQCLHFIDNFYRF